MIKTLEDAVMFATGMSIQDTQDTPIDEQRAVIEERRGESLTYRSRFPLIGRGSVLRSHAVSHNTVEREFEEMLNGKYD